MTVILKKSNLTGALLLSNQIDEQRPMGLNRQYFFAQIFQADQQHFFAYLQLTPAEKELYQQPLWFLSRLTILNTLCCTLSI